MEKTEQELYADYQLEIVNCKRLEEKLYLIKTFGPIGDWNREKCIALTPQIDSDLLASRQAITTKQNLYFAKYASLVA
jgi:hypothetical protein